MSGDQWPVFLYHGYNFNKDDPWNGLFRSAFLVTVSAVVRSAASILEHIETGVQTHFHIAKLS